jgi:hypothetical protein
MHLLPLDTQSTQFARIECKDLPDVQTRTADVSSIKGQSDFSIHLATMKACQANCLWDCGGIREKVHRFSG